MDNQRYITLEGGVIYPSENKKMEQIQPYYSTRRIYLFNWDFPQSLPPPQPPSESPKGDSEVGKAPSSFLKMVSKTSA
jgi:hypothetical protein